MRPDLEFADDVRLVFTNDDKPILRRLSRRARQIAVEMPRRPLIELQPSKRATYAESLGNFVMLLVAFRHGCLAACYRFRRYTSRLALDLLFLGPLQNRIDCLLSATF